MNTPIRWRFYGFVSKNGDKLIPGWYAKQKPEAKSTFDTSLEYLLDRPKWERPETGILHEECEGLIEIRFKANNVQHRALGFYSPGREFTIVFFATEKGGKLKPKDACRTALKLKELIQQDKRY